MNLGLMQSHKCILYLKFLMILILFTKLQPWHNACESEQIKGHLHGFLQYNSFLYIKKEQEARQTTSYLWLIEKVPVITTEQRNGRKTETSTHCYLWFQTAIYAKGKERGAVGTMCWGHDVKDVRDWADLILGIGISWVPHHPYFYSISRDQIFNKTPKYD